MPLIKKNYIIFVFIVGVFFYYILPLFCLDTPYYLIEDKYIANCIYESKSKIIHDTVKFVLCIAGGFLLGFIPGNKKTSKTDKRFILSKQRFSYCYLLAICSFVFLVYTLRHELFLGYQGQIYEDFGLRPQISAVYTIISYLTIIKIGISNELNSSPNIKNIILKTILFCSAIIMLGLGGRLYVTATAISFLCLLIVQKKTSKKNVLILSFVLVLISGVVGVLRTGNSIKSLHQLSAKSVLDESFFVFYAVIDLISKNDVQKISYPLPLIKDLSIIIPTFLFPQKSEYLSSVFLLKHHGIYIPFGSLHQMVSLNYNFGIYGSFVFMVIFGRFLNVLQQQSNNKIIFFWLLFVIGFLPTSFFRDPMGIFFYKVLLQFGFFIPLLLFKKKDCRLQIVKFN